MKRKARITVAFLVAWALTLLLTTAANLIVMTFEEAQRLMQQANAEDPSNPWQFFGPYPQEPPPLYLSFEELHLRLRRATTKQAVREVHDTFYDHPRRHRFTKAEREAFYDHYSKRMQQVDQPL